MKLKLLAPCRTDLCLRTGTLSHRDVDYTGMWTGVEGAWQEAGRMHHWNGAPVSARFHDATVDRSQHSIKYVDIGEGIGQPSAELVSLRSVLAPAGEATARVWGQAWAATRDWTVEERRTRGGGRTPPADAGLAKELDRLRTVVADREVPFTLHLFDNTVGILGADVTLDPSAPPWQEDPGSVLDLLRIFANAFADRLLRTFHDGYLVDFLETLVAWEGRLRHRHRYLRRPSADGPDALLTGQPPPRSARPAQPAHDAPNRVLWTARCLDLSDLEADDPLWKRAACLWLAEVGESQEVRQELRRIGAVPGGPGAGDGHLSREYSLRWLHYLHRPPCHEEREAEVEGPPRFDEAWSVMVQAQYHYATLEILNANLNRVIGESYVEWATSRVSRLNARVSELMARTDLLIVLYRDWQKYLPRQQLQVLHRIMDGWDFESIIQQSRRKTELCAARIETLHKKSVERSTFIMDVALIVIGFLSFISLFLELSQYGRTLLETEGPVDLLARLFTGSTDVLLIIALSLILMLTILYGFFRRKRLL